MSASNKPTLHVSELTGNVYIGRESKREPGTLLEPMDVTSRFLAIMLGKFGPGTGEDNVRETVLRPAVPGVPSYKVTIERIEA